MNRYRYIRNGASRKDGKRGVDYFCGEDELMWHVSSNIALRNEHSFRSILTPRGSPPEPEGASRKHVWSRQECLLMRWLRDM